MGKITSITPFKVTFRTSNLTPDSRRFWFRKFWRNVGTTISFYRQLTDSEFSDVPVRSSGLQAWLWTAPRQSKRARRTNALSLRACTSLENMHVFISWPLIRTSPRKCHFIRFLSRFFWQNSSATMAIKEIKPAGLIAYVGHLLIERLIEVLP